MNHPRTEIFKFIINVSKLANVAPIKLVKKDYRGKFFNCVTVRTMGIRAVDNTGEPLTQLSDCMHINRIIL